MAKALQVALAALLLAGCATAPPQPSGQLSLALFQADATPPIGHPLCGGWIKPIEAVDAPLLLKGVVFSDGRTRYVVAAIDWCVLRTGAHDLLRGKMAHAAAVLPSQVTVHCTHTHSAPIADVRAQQLLDATPGAPPHLDLGFMASLADRAAGALTAALPQLRRFTHVGTGKAKVEEYASNRRVQGPDGKILVRYSACKDPKLREAPEGLIDPWLRTVSFYDDDLPLVRLHYYATHPQSFYGDGRAHPDVPGHAREYLQEEEGVPQIYFTGCAGNVTAGKYNDGTPAARTKLGRQLYTGMIRSIAGTKRTAVSELSWKSLDVRLPVRGTPDFSEEALAKVIADPAAGQKRLHAALALAWIERLKLRPTVDVSRLRVGPVDLLHLPGEAFVEFQLQAQSVRPDRFVATASYGEGGPGYICVDKAFAEGGYEPTASYVSPPSETLLKAAIEEALK